ncbi:MAG: DNA polymerase IV [Patescibacteria group bacterium]
MFQRYNEPIEISSFPRAIIHIDGDAFFASCEQSKDPSLRGKVVVTGKERGIVGSVSYEGKALGISRSMPLFEVRKRFPQAIILQSDYETYSLLSHRFFSIVRRYTPVVEEYGIDECFADLTGMRGPLHKSYTQILDTIQKELALELGCTFSIGMSVNKVLAKVGSKWKKPSGTTLIPGRDIKTFLRDLPVQKIWGIGFATTAHLEKLGVRTSLELAEKPREWVERHFSKPMVALWRELNGEYVMELNREENSAPKSIQKFKTFTPPSSDFDFVFSQISKNIENACIKARRYGLASPRMQLVLREQNFRMYGIDITFSRKTAYPNEIVVLAKEALLKIWRPKVSYRQTGVTLILLEDAALEQPDLFGESLRTEKMERIFEKVDALQERYGKHTVYLASSEKAHRFFVHGGARGDSALRRGAELIGATKRQHLGIPIFLGEIQ